jgi:hypothetical protein
MALETVADYLRESRILLQDFVEPYRYPDAALLRAMNMGFQEVRRLRPDLLRRYLRTALPVYDDIHASVDMEEQYRLPLVWFITGYAQLCDDEEVQDQRAAGFVAMFMNTLTINGVRT